MYSAKEAAALTGLSTATLRYYEKQQLLPPIGRTAQKYRQYTDTDIEWIEMIQCLRRADVPIRSIRECVRLLAQGGETIRQRRAMVQTYIQEIHSQMAHLQKALALAERKATFYQGLLDRAAGQELSCLAEWELFKSWGGGKE